MVEAERGEAPEPSAPRLEWFPKRYGPGDLDGGGAKRLLGTPELDMVTVLVRETAQNSWDARGTASTIDFTLNLRELDQDTLALLRERVFTGEAPLAKLHDLISRDSAWALEVSDRGTVGLNGPIRNDLAVGARGETNFNDFVFNVGAPRDVHLGGGTYGFGKTIAYVASNVGTVLIWSRFEGGDGIESRLIGSAIGDSFELGEYRYTGRHWWGNRIVDEGRVEPVVGPAADALGGRAFAHEFNGNVTGTSVLILAPELGAESPEENIDLLRQAITESLWPKLMVDQVDRSRMNIRLQLNGEDVEIPPVEGHPSLGGHVDCLRVVRAVQAGRDLSELGLKLPVVHHEVWCQRPREKLGDLALMKYPVPPGATVQPSHSVTLMRNGAELVVRELERPTLDSDSYQWGGVFKPVAEVDDAFAAAEPPAHDNWIVAGMQDPAQKKRVNVAIREIKSLTDAFVRPGDAEASNGQQVVSAAVAGDALAGLLATVPGTGASAGSTTRAGGSLRQPAPRLDVVATGMTAPPAPGWASRWVEVQLAGGGSVAQKVDVKVQVGIDGGSQEDQRAVRILGWRHPKTHEYAARPIELNPGEMALFEFHYRADLAIDVDPRIVKR